MMSTRTLLLLGVILVALNGCDAINSDTSDDSLAGGDSIYTVGDNEAQSEEELFTTKHHVLNLSHPIDNDEQAAVSLNDAQGQWLLINYWAQWCRPCLKEIPDLNALNDQADITVWGVNFDGLQGDELRKSMTAMGIKFSVLLDNPAKIFGFEQPKVLPATYMIDPTRKNFHALLGEQSQESIKEVMKEMSESIR
jgi:thiol-disulfide isomerase/thioredoxin